MSHPLFRFEAGEGALSALAFRRRLALPLPSAPRSSRPGARARRGEPCFPPARTPDPYPSLDPHPPRVPLRPRIPLLPGIRIHPGFSYTRLRSRPQLPIRSGPIPSLPGSPFVRDPYPPWIPFPGRPPGACPAGSQLRAALPGAGEARTPAGPPRCRAASRPLPRGPLCAPGLSAERVCPRQPRACLLPNLRGGVSVKRGLVSGTACGL